MNGAENLPRAMPPEGADTRPMSAVPGDPDVNAFTLSEFVFCPRAGVITHESATPDAGDELRTLGLLPWYELQAIEEAWQRLFFRCCGWLAAFVVAWIVATRTSGWLPLAGFVGMLAAAYYCVQTFRALTILSRRRLAAEGAPVCEPDPDKRVAEPVNWWGLLRAGFQPDASPRPVMNQGWRLSGRPKQILRKGSLVIPVFRTKSPLQRPRAQHQIRVIAYCHLLEQAEGAWSPYGIVLLGDSYKGFTVPNTPAHRERFHETLRNVRRLIRRVRDEQLEPSAPESRSPCSTCPHGKPRRVRHGQPTISNGHELPPFLLTNKDGDMFHCNCGDRFLWRPPHEGSQRLIALS